MSKQKQVGTATESAVARFLKANGFPHAERRALAGVNDLGDITGTPGLVIEVKGGKAAENASDGQVAAWLVETDTEKLNAGADLGFLVMKRRGVGLNRAGDFWAVVDGGVFADLIYERSDGRPMFEPIGFPVRMHLHNLVEVLRDAGYGTPRD